MNIFVVTAVLSATAMAVALVYLFRTVSLQINSDAAVDPGLVLSLEKYRPMERLLQEKDFLFLASQPGFSPELGRRFRRERRRVFRGYLRSLKKDFARLASALQTLIVHSVEDRGDLQSALLRQRFQFALGLLAVEGRLLLHAAGVGTVEIGGMVQALETMQDQMRLLLNPPQAVAAAF
jgi:hypothetical protein